MLSSLTYNMLQALKNLLKPTLWILSIARNILYIMTGAKQSYKVKKKSSRNISFKLFTRAWSYSFASYLQLSCELSMWGFHYCFCVSTKSPYACGIATNHNSCLWIILLLSIISRDPNVSTNVSHLKSHIFKVFIVTSMIALKEATSIYSFWNFLVNLFSSHITSTIICKQN